MEKGRTLSTMSAVVVVEVRKTSDPVAKEGRWREILRCLVSKFSQSRSTQQRLPLRSHSRRTQTTSGSTMISSLAICFRCR